MVAMANVSGRLGSAACQVYDICLRHAPDMIILQLHSPACLVSFWLVLQRSLHERSLLM